MPLTMVLLEPVRSAEPPTISGIAGTSSASAEPECWRVAAAGFSASALAMWASTAAKAASGRSPAMARSKSPLIFEAASLASQALRTLAPLRPAARQGFNTSSGTVNGSAAQPIAARAAAISGSNSV